MSGVNCRRRKSIPSARAVALASSVLAMPGTPSSRTWPPSASAASMSSSASAWPTTTLRTSPATRACSSFTTFAPCPFRFGPHERGGECVDIGHPRRRGLCVRVLGRAEAAARRPHGRQRGQREPEQRPLDLRGQPAEPARDAVAVHGLQERDGRCAPPASATPSAAPSACVERGVLQRRRVGEQRDAPLAAARGDEQRPVGRADHGQRAAELVPAAAVGRDDRVDAGGHATRARACAAGRVVAALPPRRVVEHLVEPRRVAAAARHQPPAGAHPRPDRPRLLGLHHVGVEHDQRLVRRAAPRRRSASAAAAPDARSARSTEA